MGVEDFIDADVGVAVAATAALMSPRARNIMRRGAVYGLAGALKAGDAVGSAARGVANGVRHNGADDDPAYSGTAAAAATPATPSRARTTRPRSARATTAKPEETES